MKKIKIKNKEAYLLFERMEMYLGSGLNIRDVLNLAGKSCSKKMQVALMNSQENLDSGMTLSRALGRNIRLSKVVRVLLQHGESSGNLSDSLHQAKKMLEQQDELKKKCLTSMMYPLVIGCFSVVLTLGLVKFVLPEIVPMLKSLNVELPILTKAIIYLSDGFTKYGAYIGAANIIAYFILFYIYRRFEFIKRLVHRILIKVPLVGNLLRMYSVSIFLSSYGSLVSSGFSLHSAYSDSLLVVPIIPIKDKLLVSATNIENGKLLSDVFTKNTFPDFVAPLVSAGESSGTLGPSLTRAAQILDREIEELLKKITSLIEPAMMVFMGSVIGSIALAIMLPIYDISKAIQ